MAKKLYPGGFRLTLATARRLAVQEFGTEKGLEPDYDVMEKYERREKREALEQLVYGGGPEPCHKIIDEVWNGGRQ